MVYRKFKSLKFPCSYKIKTTHDSCKYRVVWKKLVAELCMTKQPSGSSPCYALTRVYSL